MSNIQTKKVGFLMIPIPKFILKKCLRPIRHFKFKAISLANAWWHGIWVKVKDPFWVEISSNAWIALQGRSGPEGLCSREGTDFIVLGVCGCPRSQAGSGVGVLSSSMSSKA